ncbi:hypothetical protein HMPREF0063_10698 [Aeromicrobium marinum DSM 15272]|uniref:DUF881 domain-containing protein n=1 Tax=Aeromicrobium marinum DSM 15272 TaxID=585531 RepID=E2S9Q8_9ACTN|nr:DUF881 domain-containing protein [Aeromicrobium marinum]EFQ83982.1 hypothetical protein HMPREF0063_10698 [Aeromicrobium marinum DSM 15272]
MATSRSDDPVEPRTPYSQESVGLLDQIAERALDDDYYLVRDGRYSRSRTVNGFGTAVVVTVFALMVTITAVQNYRDRPASEATRETLIADVRARQAQLETREAQAAALSAEVEDLQAADDTTETGQRARLLTGASEVTGPGIVISIDPGDGDVSDAELRGVVNTLWAVGAEAVALNGQRIGALTSIRSAGGTLTVNFRSVGPPYTIEAIGASDTLAERFLDSGEGRYWERRELGGTLVFGLSPADDLRLDAAPVSRTTVSVAAVEGGAP